MTNLGKTFFSIITAGALAAVWLLVRSDAAQPVKPQPAQLTPVQRADLVPPPPAPKVELKPAPREPPPEEEPEDGSGS